MAASCRFAFAVHILAVLAHKRTGGVTSDMLAGSVNTNPVVIRRLLSILRRAGFVITQKGAGAGSRLSRPPAEIALDTVYRAVEQAPSFSFHPQKPNQRCPVGHEIERVLTGVFNSAQTALEHALARHTLADVMATMEEKPAPVPVARAARRRG
jgi:Rrf2 family protein